LIVEVLLYHADGGSWTDEDLAVAIEAKTLCAVAEASALAISGPYGCLAGGIVYADVGPGTCLPPALAPF
jgi:hypothetical protein